MARAALERPAGTLLPPASIVDGSTVSLMTTRLRIYMGVLRIDGVLPAGPDEGQDDERDERAWSRQIVAEREALHVDQIEGRGSERNADGERSGRKRRRRREPRRPEGLPRLGMALHDASDHAGCDEEKAKGQKKR